MKEQSQILFMDDLQKRLYEMWNVDVSMTSTELIIHSLEIRNKVFVERGEHLVTNKTLVKIANCDKDVEPITELEKNFFKLKETEKILIGEISNMDFEKESLTKEAKSYIAKNMKPIVSCLRKLHVFLILYILLLSNINLILIKLKNLGSNIPAEKKRS